jgi:phage FluMu gp28-like protein
MCVYLLMQAWNNYQKMCWWTAPTYRQAKIAFNLMGTFIPPGRARASRTDMVYELLQKNGNVHSRVEFRSADNPESLRGEGVSFCVIDEAAYWGRDSFVSVWTTLTRTRGQLRIISTPKGRNWFWEEHQKSKVQPETYASYTLPTSCNPTIPRESLREAELNLPKDVYRQEYLAEFLEDGAGVFKGIIAAQDDTYRVKPLRDHQYVVGVDWAKAEDYTVFVVVDRNTKEVVNIQRHNEIDWSSNIRMAVECAKFWNRAHLIMDATGVGDVPLDAIQATYPHCQGYVIGNNTSKVQLIQKLQLAIERRDIILPRPGPGATNANVLQHELEMYSYEISTTGKWIFSAPEGYHDDCVVALALANWTAQEEPLIYRSTQVRGI